MSANRARYLKRQYEERTKENELRLVTEAIYFAAAEGRDSLVYVAKHSEYLIKSLEAQGYFVNPLLSDMLEISW